MRQSGHAPTVKAAIDGMKPKAGFGQAAAKAQHPNGNGAFLIMAPSKGITFAIEHLHTLPIGRFGLDAVNGPGKYPGVKTEQRTLFSKFEVDAR
jgi:hypothetical protein